MKKKILVLALVLVIGAVAVVCVSCAKKEETLEEGKVSYTIVNNTGTSVTAISLSDTRSENKVDSQPGEGGLPDGQSIGLELPAMLEKNAPDVMFSFTVEGGNNVAGHIMQKNGTITMKLEDGAPDFDLSEPGK